MSIKQLVIYPWLALPRRITALGVIFMPREEAISQAGEHAEYVRQATSYFYEPYAEPQDENQELPLFRLRPIAPSVVFVTEETTVDRIELATQLLVFCSMAQNQQVFYSNKTVYDHFYQDIHAANGIYSRRTVAYARKL